MARHRTSNHLSTIEYIGPRPQKKPQKRPNFLGGWVVILIAAGATYYFGGPLWSLAKEQQTAPTVQAADVSIAELETAANFGDRLAAAALKQTRNGVTYDPSYYKIDYPWGDIPSGKGKAEDLVIRSYRALGVNLQQKVYEDMTADFSAYSGLLESAAPDPSNDHRRSVNLERFFERQGQSIPATRSAKDYLPGDIVVWSKPGAAINASGQVPHHIGIVVPGPGDRKGESWVVHHLDTDIKWEDVLLSYQILGHYRYDGSVKVAAK